MEINNVQKKLIHVGISKLGIDDETYRAMLRERFGVNTCMNLQYHQADAFIDELKRKGFHIKPKRRSGDTETRRKRSTARNVVYLPSVGQMNMIEHLRKDIRWKYSDGFYRFVAKMFGRTHLRTSGEAQKLIESLKGVLKSQERGYAKEAGELRS